MKNKKGFTLIELLAVIVILAIIAIIAVPIILNVIEKSKESSAVDSAYGYIHAIEEGIVEEEVKNNNLVENKEYNDLRGFETNYDINVKGNKPTKGSFRLEKRQVVYAEFVIDGYNVVCEIGKCEAKGKTELITVTYDPDGGSVSKSSERISSGTNASLPTPTKEHYGFVGWFTAQTGGEQVTHQTVINESMTLYARWVKDSYTITFDGNGGTPDVSTKTVEHGKTLDAIPGCTAPEGYTFNGWYLEDNTEVLPSTTFTESKTLYAHYTKNIYTVTYNAGSGSVTPTSTTVEHGNTIELPTPTRLDYSFDGWYTGENGSGTKITNSTPITSTQTIYAYYIKTVTEFNYTGGVQTFTVPFDGTYKLETWGAQGGYAYNSTYHGGYGGYSVGTFALNANENIYVVVGGKGTDGPTYGTYNGGYNGGGTGSSKRNNEHEFIVGAGGGATHIAKDSGLLSSLSSHASDNRILIVSGGGGGATYNNNAVEASWRGYNYGGSGGGYNGGHVYGTVSNTTASLGGLQEPREQSEFSGDFGQGAIGTYYGTTSGASCGSWPNYCRQIAGGGGGYYGGASGWGHGGGGGSGYIANTFLTNKHMYCFNCPTSTETNINTISDGTNSCHNSNPTIDCAKEGHGYARITYLGE